MAQTRRFVLFELNEVPLRVVRHYADRHPQSAFAKMLRTGRRWDTVTPDTGHLSPWITWPTLHRGVSSEEHHIVALGQDVSDVNRRYPPVWTLLADAGRRVGMFGSLHSYPPPGNLEPYDFYVPDTFAAGPEAKPKELSAFQAFNLHMVDRSGRNVSSELPVKEALGFLMRALPAGIKPATLGKVARQVASERIWADRTARRRTIQSLLAFDLFSAQMQSKQPDAAFFFTNHVASAMHRYWPATFSEDYHATKWSDSWLRRFAGELDYTMGEADQMLSELIAFADRHPDYLILVSGSMGQAAVDGQQAQVKTEVHLRDLSQFLAFLGVSGKPQRRRTMEPTYTLAFDSPAEVEAFADAVAKLKVADQPVAHRVLNPCEVEFVLGHPNVPDGELTVAVGNRSVGPAEAGLANVHIDDEAGAAAYHVPEGMLLVYDPQRNWEGRAEPEPISTTRIAPTLLALQAVAPAAYMEPPIEGFAQAELEPA
ncbi:MAG TPA: hypothetical protein VNA29_03115 [Sphingomicrobium sp.]|nr:hypothetical protein [Sphingomicrobium sp.]